MSKSKQESNLLWNTLKWLCLIVSLVALLIALNVDSAWVQEVFSSIAGVGFLGSLAFWIHDM